MRPAITLQILSSLVMFVALSTATAWGKDCGDTSGPGGSDVPCECGDTVTTSTVLTDTDPVTTGVCACDGLGVRSSRTLDLGGRTVTGSGSCVGINMGGGFSSDNVVVGGGQITGFGTGVLSSGEPGPVRLHNVRVVENSLRGVILGPQAIIEDCIVSRNGGTGIEVNTGTDPPGGGVVRRCRVEDNQGDGIVGGFRGTVIQNNVVRRNAGRGIEVCCSGNTVSLNRVEDNEWGIVVSGASPEHGTTSVTRNVVLRNGIDGVAIDGLGVLVDRNQSKYNADRGFEFSGTGHLVSGNSAVSNGLDGFAVNAVETTFSRNVSNYNGRPTRTEPADGFGIQDFTAGSGTGGTANTYTGNGCTGNGQGNSSPAGLCF